MPNHPCLLTLVTVISTVGHVRVQPCRDGADTCRCSHAGVVLAEAQVRALAVRKPAHGADESAAACIACHAGVHPSPPKDIQGHMRGSCACQGTRVTYPPFAPPVFVHQCFTYWMAKDIFLKKPNSDIHQKHTSQHFTND